jgi:hypothetical protein
MVLRRVQFLHQSQCTCVTNDDDFITDDFITVMMILLQEKKKQESGKKCHVELLLWTMMQRKPIKLST